MSWSFFGSFLHCGLAYSSICCERFPQEQEVEVLKELIYMLCLFFSFWS